MGQFLHLFLCVLLLCSAAEARNPEDWKKYERVEPLDTAALDRALKFGMDFKTGIISACTLLEFADGKKWQVLVVYRNAAHLQRQDGTYVREIYFNDFDEMSRIVKVYHVDRSAPACVIFN
jgi:hypothetical protein